MKKNKPVKIKHSPRSYVVWVCCGFVLLLLIVMLTFRLSPWPGVFVIRAVFDKGSHKTLAHMEQDMPQEDNVTILSDQRYGKDSKELLDVYLPPAPSPAMPTVIWTHGGGWLSGDKTNVAPYFKHLANQGFTVISLNYTLAPAAVYPTQIKQLNEAHGYILQHAARLHVNPNAIVLAGDSAGSQLSSEMAAIATNPAYAAEVGVTPALSSANLKGVVLFCGIYKMEGLAEPDPVLPKILNWGDATTVWAYSGTRDRSAPVIRQMSPYYHVTGDYPAAFISGGNADPLTNAQSVPFTQELQRLNVETTTLFYSPNHTPALPHEYQFTWNADGQNAFNAMATFIKQKTQ